MAEILESQRKQIAASVQKYEQNRQLEMQFDQEARRQREADYRYWRRRLDAIEREFADEPARIRTSYEVRATRIEPVGRIERHEFEYERHGKSTLLVSLHVLDGTMWGCCLARNDHEHFLWGVRQVAHRYRTARRIHLIMDNGSAHIDPHTQAYFAAHPRLRVLFTPAHASWLNQAELLLRAFSDKYLNCFDCRSQQKLITHLNASWREYNRYFAHPFRWSWTRRHMYHWAESMGASISSKTYAAVH